jgi:hypothetical protein
VLSGGHENVKVFVTAGTAHSVRKWVDTKMFGVLRLIKVQQVASYDVVVIQVMQVDEAGNERSKVLEYELPVNFKFDPDLSPVFVAVEIIKQQYLGLYFESVDEKQKFIAALQDLYLKLTINRVDLGAIKDHCQKELDQEYQAQLAEAISVTDLLSGQDQNKQA